MSKIQKRKILRKVKMLVIGCAVASLVLGTAKNISAAPQQEIIDLSMISYEESYLLGKIAMAEAEGEGVEEKALVMLTVINRVNSEQFPNTIKEVIFQPGEFSPLIDGRWDDVEPDDDCWEAFYMIHEEGWDESQGALYFESRSDSEWHRKNLKFLYKSGNLYFYK